MRVNRAPEDRLNAFAARLLAAQPDPPRTVGLADILKTDISLLGLVVLPAVLAAGGLVAHQQALAFGLLGVGGLVLVFSVVAQQGSDARRALQQGIAGAGEITRVVPGFRASKIVTIRVDGPSGTTETQLARSGGANVLVEGDTVQVMLDPQTRQVLLVLGLLKPSPLYAPPSR